MKRKFSAVLMRIALALSVASPAYADTKSGTHSCAFGTRSAVHGEQHIDK